MKRDDKQPSRMALAFFHWFCRPEFREEIEGDLLERFSTNFQKYGSAKANRLFMEDVVLLFRPSIVGNIYQLTNTDIMVINKQNNRLVTILMGAFALLLVPLVAMALTNEVDWNILDFLVAGALLGGAGLTLEFILRKIPTKRSRLLLIIGLFLLLTLLWAEMAVGIFGTLIAGS